VKDADELRPEGGGSKMVSSGTVPCSALSLNHILQECHCFLPCTVTARGPAYKYEAGTNEISIFVFLFFRSADH